MMNCMFSLQVFDVDERWHMVLHSRIYMLNNNTADNRPGPRCIFLQYNILMSLMNKEKLQRTLLSRKSSSEKNLKLISMVVMGHARCARKVGEIALNVISKYIDSQNILVGRCHTYIT